MKEIKQSRVEGIQDRKSRKRQQINTNVSCDRTNKLIMDIKSVFTASKSNTQHNMAAKEIDSDLAASHQSYRLEE